MGNFTSAPVPLTEQSQQSASGGFSNASSAPTNIAPLNRTNTPSINTPRADGIKERNGERPSIGDSPYFGSPLSTPIKSVNFHPSFELGRRSEEERQLYPTVISWNHGGHDVNVTGAFNNWKDKIPLSRSHDDFTTVLNLPAGTHEFRFIIDGEIRCSSDFPAVPNATGNLVNYIEVSPAQDSSLEESDQNDDKDWTQDIPQSISEKEPPKLPPHLNKVLLNSENVSNDPAVLPVPHHVMLNHLYALSIKDRIMVLATTSRYQQKYVTTVMYKPVFS